MNNNAPLIGISCYQDTSSDYFQSQLTAQDTAYMTALTEAGAIPFLIPLNLAESALRRLYNLAAGILLPGGGDIDPKLLGHEPHPTLSNVQPERDTVEIMLSRWAGEDRKPVLGICRGIQVMAVSYGGTTVCQDLPSLRPTATKHHYGYSNGDSPALDELVHQVELRPNSLLAEILETTQIAVNSLHHQAVTSVSVPLKITGTSEDGVIEALELPGHPFFCGVQWHPELMIDKYQSMQAIFSAFVKAAEVEADK